MNDMQKITTLSYLPVNPTMCLVLISMELNVTETINLEGLWVWLRFLFAWTSV